MDDGEFCPITAMFENDSHAKAVKKMVQDLEDAFQAESGSQKQ